MIKSKISFICTAAILLIITSCSGRQGADAGLISINYKELTDKGTVNLSDLFEEPEFIALDSASPADITRAIHTNSMTGPPENISGQ